MPVSSLPKTGLDALTLDNSSVIQYLQSIDIPYLLICVSVLDMSFLGEES